MRRILPSLLPGLLPGLLAGLLAALALPSCTIIETRQLAVPTPEVRTAAPARAWRVVDGAEERGSVVLYESRAGDELAGSFFGVRNAWQQDVGLVDELGRAWAYRPHRREAEWVGSGSVASGAASILGLGSCDLVEVPLQTLETSALQASAATGATSLR